MTDHGIRYTYDVYRDILDDLVDCGYEFVGYGDPMSDSSILLRHDVDLSPERALEMAEIESEYGIESTYFFLLGSPLYNLQFGENVDILREIREMGHRIGLHFGTHKYWQTEPDEESLVEEIRRELTILRNIVQPVSTVISFHIPPEWVLGREFGPFRHVYEPAYFEEIAYVADSSQRWRSEPPFPEGIPNRCQLLTHPSLWAESDATFEERLAETRDSQFDRIRTYIDEQFVE
ncbi:polysaccharide deacetylase family protein [Halovenus aranensis]|uniref:polysaccharide deacetylase family protein n=1 Tax=Halovenus aranensis TaxID=890420 RepID=UPI000B892261|nr:polysaccharide deacetylase family protein [Halovenus aranensis]